MQLVIHAGFAFTDEGRLFQSLHANKRGLTRHGATVLRPRRFWRNFAPVLQTLWTESPTSELQTQLQQLLTIEADTTRMILSSDSFLGVKPVAIHDGQFYPFAGQRLASLDRVLGDTEIEVFLSLLNPGVFIPKVLRSLTDSQCQNIFNNTDLSCLSWLSVIEDIRDLAPNVKLTLWSNEDTPLIWGDILRAMGGLPDGVPLNDEYGLLNSLLNPTGQRVALSLAEQKPVLEREIFQSELMRLLQDYSEPGKLEEEIDLPGWSDEVLSAFSELYEQDLFQIRNMPDIRFLTP